MEIDKVVGELIRVLLNDNSLRKATKFITSNNVVKISRKLFKEKRTTLGGIEEFLVTIGKPNYAERQFIASRIKARDTFPVEKIKLSYIKRRKDESKRACKYS